MDSVAFLGRTYRIGPEAEAILGRGRGSLLWTAGPWRSGCPTESAGTAQLAGH